MTPDLKAAPWALGLVASLSLVACGGETSNGAAGRSDDATNGAGDPNGDGGDGGDALVALRIEPPVIELDVDSGDTAQFRVIARASSGDETDVSTEAAWLATPTTLGRMSGATFVPAGPAGTATVNAYYNGLSAAATVQLNLEASVSIPVAPGQVELPPQPELLFDSVAPSDEAPPRLVYPLDGVLLPPNLGKVDVHYRPGPHSLFEVSFTSPRVDVRFYTRCTPLHDGCRFNLDGELYSRIAEAAAGGPPVQVRVRGTSDDGETVGASAQVQVSFSARPVDGGFYYWATNAESIMRVDFGAGNEPERFFPFEDTSTCFGCHALSPNGERMSLSREGQRNGELYLLDVRTGEMILNGTSGDEEQFQSWSPDSSRFAAIYGDDDRPDLHDEIRIRSGETGEILERISIGHEPTHPDWSPAGDRIAYTRVTRHQTSQRPGRGGISFVRHSGDGWGEPQTLIEPEDSLNYYNPAYAPDGSFLAFNRSVCPEGQIYASSCDGDADPSARLFAIRSEGGPHVELARANAPGPEDGESTDLSHTFPRWAPFIDARWADGTGRLMWMTFSSRRQYGLHPLPGADNGTPGQLLWMVGIDPDAVLRGEDGSAAAFALPFQDLSTSNHIGQWTQRVVPVEPDPGQGGPDGGPACRERGESCAEVDCCLGLICREDGDGAVCRSSL